MPLHGKPIAAWIHDFHRSSRFKKFSSHKKTQMAIAAYYSDKRRTERAQRASRHLKDDVDYLAEYFKDEHDRYSMNKGHGQLVSLLQQAYHKAKSGHSALDHAIAHWLEAEMHQFGQFEHMPEANLKDNWDDYCSLMVGAHGSVHEDVQWHGMNFRSKKTRVVKNPRHKYNRTSYVAKSAAPTGKIHK